MESQDLPPPRQMKDGKMAKWLVFGLRAASSLIWGDGPLLFDGGGGGKWKIFTCKYIFFYMDAAPAANDFFVCVSIFLQTL